MDRSFMLTSRACCRTRAESGRPVRRTVGPWRTRMTTTQRRRRLRLRDSWTISNTLLNVFSVTFNRFRNPSDARSREGNWPSTLGLGDFGAGNFPIIKFQGVNSDQHRYVAGLPIDETLLGSQFNDFYAANTFIYDDTLSWVRGRHTYKFGAEFRVQQFNSHGDFGVPTFIFDPAQTAGILRCQRRFRICQLLVGRRQSGVGQRTGQYVWSTEVRIVVCAGRYQGYAEVYFKPGFALGFQRTLSRKVRSLVELRHNCDQSGHRPARRFGIRDEWRRFV